VYLWVPYDSHLPSVIFLYIIKSVVFVVESRLYSLWRRKYDPG